MLAFLLVSSSFCLLWRCAAPFCTKARVVTSHLSPSSTRVLILGYPVGLFLCQMAVGEPPLPFASSIPLFCSDHPTLPLCTHLLRCGPSTLLYQPRLSGPLLNFPRQNPACSDPLFSPLLLCLWVSPLIVCALPPSVFLTSCASMVPGNLLQTYRVFVRSSLFRVPCPHPYNFQIFGPLGYSDSTRHIRF